MKKIYNCLEYWLNEPILPQNKERKHLYILESLSSTIVAHKDREITMLPYDILVAQNLTSLCLQSFNRNPILLRLYSIYFDLPLPLSNYTVGNNPLIHDLMNEEKSGDAFVLFTHLDDKICHAYLDAVEALESSSQNKNDEYISFQIQKVSGLLFTELLHNHTQKISKSASQFPSAQVKYASKDTQAGIIMKYVTENIHQVTLKETAEHFAYQSNYFSRLCQQLFGVSFNELKTHIRLELAKEQLRLTTKSLEEISQELGYKAVSNFHRNFKSHTGLTPREYRQESQLPQFKD